MHAPIMMYNEKKKEKLKRKEKIDQNDCVCIETNHYKSIEKLSNHSVDVY